MTKAYKEIEFVGSARNDLNDFPSDVKTVMGYALWIAQQGGKHADAKPLKGFKGAGVLEIVENFDSDTYRTIYTVKLGDVIYVLHAFQKKSKRGAETPKHEIDLIKDRYAAAKKEHEKRVKSST